ncbi:beta-1,3-galactosyl-O-glycosyl-glycoprotein beta-1,6-N-acetylglucosaminyltransferase 3 [Biomphalaria glabrata]|nr:beta-1,3-galactosyl-O-glycosyl-glycoprotein beta-1,6-N-acetylglucosaminyltransferase 3 [Biomphalaria glabrata]
MKFLSLCYIQWSGHCKKLFFALTFVFTLVAVCLHMSLNPVNTKAVCDNTKTDVYHWALQTSQESKEIKDFTFHPDIQKINISYAYERQWVGFPNVARIDCEYSLKYRAINKSYPKTVKRILPIHFIEDSRNCSAFLDKYGYRRYPQASIEERNFPIAFVLLFHKDIDQVHFLLRAIYRPHNVYCLSVDVKSSVEFLAATKSLAECLPNVFVSSKLENIVYGGYSRLMADINCFQDLVKHPVPWRYVINSPGQQFPLRTNLELVKILKLLNGTNDVLGVTGESRNIERFMTKWKYITNETTGDVYLMPTSDKNDPPPHNLDVVKCSAYGAFSRAFVHFVLTSPISRDLLNWSRAVYSPDEMFWATLNYNTISPAPGGFKGVPTNRPWLASFSLWPWDNLPCHSKFVRQICIFGIDDLPLLMSTHALFANKFYINHEPMALHCLDQYLYNLTMLGEPRDTSYYQNHFMTK